MRGRCGSGPAGPMSERASLLFLSADGPPKSPGCSPPSSIHQRSTIVPLTLAKMAPSAPASAIHAAYAIAGAHARKNATTATPRRRPANADMTGAEDRARIAVRAAPTGVIHVFWRPRSLFTAWPATRSQTPTSMNRTASHGVKTMGECPKPVTTAVSNEPTASPVPPMARTSHTERGFNGRPVGEQLGRCPWEWA